MKNCGGRVEEFIIPKKHISELIVMPTSMTTTTSTTTTTTTTTAITEKTSTTAKELSHLNGADNSIHPVRIVRVEASEEANGDDETMEQDDSPFKRRKMKRVRIVHRDGTSVESAHAIQPAAADSPRAGNTRFRLRSRHLPATGSRGDDSSDQEEPDNLAESSSDIVVRTRFPERRGGLLAATGQRAAPRALPPVSASGGKISGEQRRLINNAFRARRNHSFSDSSNSSQNRDGSAGPTRKRRLSIAGRRIDEIVKAPPHMKGGLIVIKSFCRYPPHVEASCLSSSGNLETLHFHYDVRSASCLPFKGDCSYSRNKFSSELECLNTCIVKNDE